MRRALLWMALTLALVTAGYYIYQNHFEWVDVEIEGPMSVQARKHDMLAASRYLEQLGYRTTEITDSDFFSQLTPWVDTIVLQELPDTLTDEMYDNLLDWVERGGHLVLGLEGGGHGDAVDAFYEAVGVTVTDEFEGSAERYTLEVDGAGYPERMSVQMEPGFLFTLWAGTAVSLTVRLQDLFAYAQLEYGAGHITAFADSGLWSNDRIGSQDNARLLAATIAAHTSAASTIYISDTNTSLPGIFTMIWQRWQWFCLVMVALGLAWLRQAWVRFGPIHRDVETRSNNFARHLLAVAQFQGRYLSYDRLLEPARQHVLSRYAYRQAGAAVAADDTRADAANDEASSALNAQTSVVAPDATTIDKTELLNRVHQTSGIPQEAIDRALFQSANKATILPIVSTLQAIDRRAENNAE